MALWLECPQKKGEMCLRDDAEKVDIKSHCKPARLKNKRIIAGIRFGKTFKNDILTIKYLNNESFCLGISIRKKIGCACVRNYIKRRSRHAFEMAANNMNYGFTCMLYCTKELKEIKFQNLVKLFQEFFKEISHVKKI